MEERTGNALKDSGIGLLIGGSRWENSELTLSDWGLKKLTVKVYCFEGLLFIGFGGSIGFIGFMGVYRGLGTHILLLKPDFLLREATVSAGP